VLPLELRRQLHHHGRDGVIVPLIGAGVKSKSARSSTRSGGSIAYLEPQYDQDKTPARRVRHAGLVSRCSTRARWYRGGITVGDLLYLARGNIFEVLQQRLRTTDLNAASAAHDEQRPHEHGDERDDVLVLADGTNAYNYTLGRAFAQIASAMFAKPEDGHLPGRLLPRVVR
jgi:hypothetical protein